MTIPAWLGYYLIVVGALSHLFVLFFILLVLIHEYDDWRDRRSFALLDQHPRNPDASAGPDEAA